MFNNGVFHFPKAAIVLSVSPHSNLHSSKTVFLSLKITIFRKKGICILAKMKRISRITIVFLQVSSSENNNMPSNATGCPNCFKKSHRGGGESNMRNPNLPSDLLSDHSMNKSFNKYRVCINFMVDGTTSVLRKFGNTEYGARGLSKTFSHEVLGWGCRLAATMSLLIAS